MFNWELAKTMTFKASVASIISGIALILTDKGSLGEGMNLIAFGLVGIFLRRGMLKK